MNIKSFIKDTKKMSMVATVIIFLALLRTLSEPFRLQYYSRTSLTFGQVKPFLFGGIVCSVGLLVMIFFSFHGKYKKTMATSVFIVILLLLIKIIYIKM